MQLELDANHLHEVTMELIAQENGLPYKYKDFEEEKAVYTKANKILIQKIQNNEFEANTPREKILLKLLLDIAEECCTQFGK